MFRFHSEFKKPIGTGDNDDDDDDDYDDDVIVIDGYRYAFTSFWKQILSILIVDISITFIYLEDGFINCESIYICYLI